MWYNAAMTKSLKDRIADGIARRLAGDEAGFFRVDDEIQADPALRCEPAAEKFHALRIAACGAALVLAAGCTPDSEPPPNCVYAGPPEDAVSRQAPPAPAAPRPSPRPESAPAPADGGPRSSRNDKVPGPVPPPPAER